MDDATGQASPYSPHEIKLNYINFPEALKHT